MEYVNSNRNSSRLTERIEKICNSIENVKCNEIKSFYKTELFIIFLANIYMGLKGFMSSKIRLGIKNILINIDDPPLMKINI